MKIDMPLVEDLKNGNLQRSNFFKEQLRKELNGSFLKEEEKEALVEQAFLEAVETYTKETAVRFPFYAKSILKKLEKAQAPATMVENNYFSYEEMRILQFYFTHSFDSSLLVKELSMPFDKTIQTIQKFYHIYKKQPRAMKELFPDVSSFSPQRKEAKKEEKERLSQDELELIGSFTGEIDDVCLDIAELAQKYHQTEYAIKESLEQAIRKLKREENRLLLEKTYPNALSMLKIRRKLLNDSVHSVSKRKTSTTYYGPIAILTEKNKDFLLKLKEQEENFLTNQEIAEQLGYSIKYFHSVEAKLFRKLKKHEALYEQAKEIYPHLSLEKQISFSTPERLMIRAFKEKVEKPLMSEEEMREKMPFPSDRSYRLAKKKLYQKLQEHEVLKEQLEHFLPAYQDYLFPPEKKKEEKEEKVTTFSPQEEAFLSLFERQYQELLTNQEILKETTFQTSQGLSRFKSSWKEKIEQNEALFKLVTEKYPHAFLSLPLSDSEKLLLRSVKEQQENPTITEDEIVRKYGYSSFGYYRNAKNNLLQKIKEQEVLKAYCQAFFSNIESSSPEVFSQKEKNLLRALERQYDEFLTLSETMALLPYQSQRQFLNAKTTLTERIKKQGLIEEAKGIALNYTEWKRDPLKFDQSKRLLKALDKQARDSSFTDQDIVQELNYANVKSFHAAKEKLYQIILSDPSLIERVTKVFPSLEKAVRSLQTKKQRDEKLEYQYFALAERQVTELLTIREIIQDLSLKNYANFARLRKQIEQKLAEDKAYYAKIKEEFPHFDEPITIKDSTRLLFRALKKQREDPSITDQQIAEQLHFASLKDYFDTKQRTLKRLEQDENMQQQLNVFLKGFMEAPQNSSFSKQEQQMLTLLEKQYTDLLTNREIRKLTNLQADSAFHFFKKKLEQKIQSSPTLEEEAKEFYPHYSKADPTLTDQNRLLLRYLKEQKEDPSITDQQIKEKLKYQNDLSLTQAKCRLKKKILASEKLQEQLKDYSPMLGNSYEQRKMALTEREKELLQILRQEEEGKISLEEAIELSQYKNKNSFYSMKRTLKVRIKNNPPLQEEAKEIYPHFMEKKSKSLLLTEQEFRLLQDIYAIQGTEYKSQGVIAEAHDLKPATFYFKKKKMEEKLEHQETMKVVLTKWPTFQEDRLIRQNFSKKQSISLSEEELRTIKRKSRQWDFPFQPKEEDTKTNLWNGIQNLENSIFSDYASHCTYEQKTMLALRFGFFNRHPFPTKDIAELFQVEPEEVMELSKQCLIHCKDKLKEKPKVKQKKI